MARRLQLPSGQTGALVTDVDPDGPSAGAAAPGRRHPVGEPASRWRTPPTPARELQKVQSGHIAQMLRLARRRRGVRHRSRRIDAIQIADATIRERGPLTVAAFMDLALYDPELGYYARAAQRSGRAGDFFTSVDVGPLFGELLEVQLAEMAAILAASSPSAAPSATFDPRRSRRRQRPAVRRHPPRGATRRSRRSTIAIRLHLVEASAAARAAQADDARRRRRPTRVDRHRAARRRSRAC